MTRIMRIIVAFGFMWLLVVATRDVVPMVQTDTTGGSGFGLLLGWVALLLVWLLVDKIVRMLGSIFGRGTNASA